MWQFLPLILTCLVRHKTTYNCDLYDYLATEAGPDPAFELWTVIQLITSSRWAIVLSAQSNITSVSPQLNHIQLLFATPCLRSIEKKEVSAPIPFVALVRLELTLALVYTILN